MFDVLKESIEESFRCENHQDIKIKDQELRDALEQVGRDLVYNYFIFQKDVSYNTFLENLKTYLRICIRRDL